MAKIWKNDIIMNNMYEFLSPNPELKVDKTSVYAKVIHNHECKLEGQESRYFKYGAVETSDNPDLMFVVPTYHKEWSRGTMPIHMEAFLNQRLPPNKKIEINYSVNYGDSDSSNKSDFEIKKEYQDTLSMVGFLEKVVVVQKLSQQITALGTEDSSSLKKEIKALLESETDAKLKNILTLASNKWDQVMISFLDTSELRDIDYYNLGYKSDGSKIIGFHRTLGVDYSRKRNAAIVSLNDIDALPSSNNLSRELIEFYKKNPQLEYFLNSINYQFPMSTDGVLNTSSVNTTQRILNYNANLKNPLIANSSQISFRKSCLEQIDGIAPIRSFKKNYERQLFSGWEDFDTAANLYLHGNKHEVPIGILGIFQSMDRIEGFIDGSVGRNEMNFNFGRFKFWANELKISQLEILKKLTQNYGAEQASLILSKYEKKYELQTRKTHRFYRIAARRFIELLRTGDIFFRIDNNGNSKKKIEFDPQKIREKSKILLRYLEYNRDFLEDILDEDIDYLSHVLGVIKDTLPIEHKITDRQQAIREWFGEYTNPKEVFQLFNDNPNLVSQLGKTEETNKKSLIQGHMLNP